MPEKVTEMVLEVDLQCQRCYKKVKKVLCKFPQIRDQAYDEKKNVVKIKVFCCNPEKIRDKLCCKGGGCIKSIEIVEPPAKPPSTPTPQPKPTPTTPPKTTPTPQPKPTPTTPPKTTPTTPPKPDPKPDSKPEPPPKPEPPMRHPPCYPRGVCCGQCYEGQAGGPCYYWYGRPPPPLPSAGCDGYGYRYGYGYGYGYGHGYDYGWNRGCSVCRCGECFCDKNPAACR